MQQLFQAALNYKNWEKLWPRYFFSWNIFHFKHLHFFFLSGSVLQWKGHYFVGKVFIFANPLCYINRLQGIVKHNRDVCGPSRANQQILRQRYPANHCKLYKTDSRATEERKADMDPDWNWNAEKLKEQNLSIKSYLCRRGLATSWIILKLTLC